MHISYRKELEKAAHQMILIHRTDTLIKLIIRTALRILKVSHAGIFLFDKARGNYVLNVSKGKRGVKIPMGLVKLSHKSPLLLYFLEDKRKIWADNFLTYERVRAAIKKYSGRGDKGKQVFFEELLHQFTMYKARIAFPIVFREELFGILILGGKSGQKNFSSEEIIFLSILSSDVAMAIRNASLFEDLNTQLDKNQNLFFQTITALAQAIEAKDRYTIGHTERVVEYSLAIAEELRKKKAIKNWTDFRQKLKISALLHDIGKIGVPERVLNKKSKLNKKDWSFIKTHPLIGEYILSPISELREVIEAVKHHHERFDGKGYPDGLKGNQIPLIAAIISVADAYDAMTSERPYRKAFPKESSKKEIVKNRNTQFYPKVVTAFISAYNSGKF